VGGKSRSKDEKEIANTEEGQFPSCVGRLRGVGEKMSEKRIPAKRKDSDSYPEKLPIVEKPKGKKPKIS